MTAPTRAHLALVGVVLLALAIRLLGFDWVFVGDSVVFAPSDAMYHMRRALFGFVNYPDILMWDSYINYPDGAPIPWPPLFDFTLSTVGRLIASDEAGFERVAACTPPVLGALTVLAVYGIGRRLDGRGVGLAAGAIYALLPVAVSYSRVGNTDHHCAVAFVGACLLYLAIRIVALQPGDPGARRLAVGLAVGRAAMLLTWHGNLLYLALLEASLLLAAALGGRREIAGVVLASAIATLALIVPVLSASPPPLAGPWSAIALSRLHVLVLVTVALCAAGLLAQGRWRPGAGPLARLALVGGVAFALSIGALLLPGPREGLMPALEFLTLEDAMGAQTGEQFALFAFAGRRSDPDPLRTWGAFAWALPALLVALTWLARRGPGYAVLAGWSVVLGGLAIHQVRYGNDFAPAASVGLALVGAELARAASARLGVHPLVAAGTALALAAAALLPPAAWIYGKRLRSGWGTLTGSHWVEDRMGATVAGTLTRFLEEVRAHTPETRSYLTPAGTPEYGIVASPNLGHAIQYVARRATPADPFWSYIGQENWDRNHALLEAKNEHEALALARALRARFVVSTSRARGDTLEAHLHQLDGLPAVQRPRLARFRLVTEAPSGSPTLRSMFSPGEPDPDVAYKLWEIVPGALLEVHAQPGARLGLWLDVVTNHGRSFVYHARTAAGDDGVSRIRVPYATDAGDDPVHATGRYRIRSGDREASVDVSTDAVRQGESIRVSLAE